MPKIQFSHIYPKLLDSHNDAIESAKLIHMGKIKLKDLHPSFLFYDTHNGEHKLPKKGEFLMLIFLKPYESYISEQNLFTTLRRYTPAKEGYYSKKIGQEFEVVINI